MSDDTPPPAPGQPDPEERPAPGAPSYQPMPPPPPGAMPPPPGTPPLPAPPGSYPAPPPAGAAPPPPSGTSYGYASGPVDTLGRPLAEWWQRLVAIIIDLFILSVVALILTAIAGRSDAARSNLDRVFNGHVSTAQVIVGIVVIVIDIAYFAILNGSAKGQTVGMMVLGIAVRDGQSGGPIRPARAGCRFLVLYPGVAVGWIPVLGIIAVVYTIACGLSPLWDKKREGWHDKMAKTTVVKVR